MSKSSDPQPAQEDSLRCGDLATRRKLRFEEIRKICGENCPISLERLISKIELRTGLTRKTANQLLIPLYDDGYISINKEKIVSVIK